MLFVWSSFILDTLRKFGRRTVPGQTASDGDVSIAVEINAEHYMVHSPAWKMIFDINRNESTVLFDLRRDPHENVNLLAAHQAQVGTRGAAGCTHNLPGS